MIWNIEKRLSNLSNPWVSTTPFNHFRASGQGLNSNEVCIINFVKHKKYTSGDLLKTILELSFWTFKSTYVINRWTEFKTWQLFQLFAQIGVEIIVIYVKKNHSEINAFINFLSKDCPATLLIHKKWHTIWNIPLF